MGNSQNTSLRHVVNEGNMVALATMLENERAREYMIIPLNRKGDTALILSARLGKVDMVEQLLHHSELCIVNAINRENDTALDVALDKALPPDGDILHHHFCPYAAVENSAFEIPKMIKLLLKAGARGKCLDRLILHCMKYEAVITEIVNLLDDLTHPTQFRVSGLLLQITVWFDQSENVELLLRRGIDVENFWKTSFMPRIQPSSYHRSVQWPRGEAAEYIINQLPDSDVIQSLKFSFIQDWRADWNDGENPSAQFRAGLQLTPDCAILFARAANSNRILMRIMHDIMLYLPVVCSGPDLTQTSLIQCFTLAGYQFTQEEMQHLQLKFNINLGFYTAFVNGPNSLKHLARISFRRNLKHNVFYALDQLDYLPEPIKDYITLHDSFRS